MPTFDTDFQSLDRQTTKGRAILALRDCVDALVAGGGDDLGNHTATQALDMAGFQIDGVITITGPNSASGVDAPNMLIKGGSPAGSASADGAQIDIVGGDAQDIGQAGDISIRGGNADRVPGGAILISAGFSLTGTANTGGVVTIQTGQGGSVSGNGGSMNFITANGRGTGNAGKMSLRPGAGDTGGGDGGIFEVLGGPAGGAGGTGSAIEITSGPGFFSGVGDSGDVTIQVGAVPVTGSAGTFNLLGADGTTGSTINITAGGSSVGLSGGIEIKGGDSSGVLIGDTGGAINITGGLGGAHVTGKGGTVDITAGPSAVGATTLAAFATLRGGAANGPGFGGTSQVIGGAAGVTGGGGQARIEGAAGGATSGNGGGVQVRGGSATLGDGGDIDLEPGNTASGVKGVCNLHDGNGAIVGQFDENTTAGETRFLLYDVDNGTLERVTVGAADSGGVGFKVLRIPN